MSQVALCNYTSNDNNNNDNTSEDSTQLPTIYRWVSVSFKNSPQIVEKSILRAFSSRTRIHTSLDIGTETDIYL